jgi:hypothetical protein
VSGILDGIHEDFRMHITCWAAASEAYELSFDTLAYFQKPLRPFQPFLSSELYVIAESRVADSVVTEVAAKVEAPGRWIAVERLGKQLHAKMECSFFYVLGKAKDHVRKMRNSLAAIEWKTRSCER